ncbi:GAF domain-containing protein [Actinomadura fibrosa]|uniref:GAF domain-containing protein n=1 Tax=Actinomadura fibrosa TaxID=111802 RepID=A0ABW2Y1K8_9ACTN|nr:GAF domain-containing protein [Actinomadura fibrosa]
MNLAIAVSQGGQALTAGLANIASADSFEERQSSVRVLIDRVLRLTHTELGRQIDREANVRASFYQFLGQDLVHSASVGPTLGVPPRYVFERGRSDRDDTVIRFALGLEAVLVTDTEADLPDNFNVIVGRGYRSFLAAPVRAGRDSFGLLVATSEKPAVFTDIDKGLLGLMASVLGIAFVQLNATHPVEKGLPPYVATPISSREEGA